MERFSKLEELEACIDHTDAHLEWLPCREDSLLDHHRDALLQRERDWRAHPHWNMWVTELSMADKVHDGIWIGSEEAAMSYHLLHSNDIKVVLNMAIEIDDPEVPGVRRVKVGMSDGEMPNCGLFERAAGVIKEARQDGHSILVHCAAGISRSTTAVLTYMMLHEETPWEVALARVASKRSIVNPHPMLMRSLMRDIGTRFVP